MKKRLFISIICLLGIFVSCSKDEDSKLDENQLTPAINNLVPDEILDEIISLGMPINRGATPPNVENTYFCTPFILKASNRPGDNAGMSFQDMTLTFKNQNNENLTISMDYFTGNGGAGTESGNGIGAYIVGTGNNVTIFAKTSSDISGDPADLLHVISGTVTASGISNLHYANFMLNNYGNPNGKWIEEGEGRIIYDSDGSSPIVTSSMQKSTTIEKLKSPAGI